MESEPVTVIRRWGTADRLLDIEFESTLQGKEILSVSVTIEVLRGDALDEGEVSLPSLPVSTVRFDLPLRSNLTREFTLFKGFQLEVSMRLVAIGSDTAVGVPHVWADLHYGEPQPVHHFEGVIPWIHPSS